MIGVLMDRGPTRVSLGPKVKAVGLEVVGKR